MPQDQEPQVSIEDFEEKRRQYYGIPKGLAESLKTQESGGNQYDKTGGVLTSPKQAKGRFQVLQSTADQYKLNADDPFENTEAAFRYLSDLHKKVDPKVTDPGERWSTVLNGYHAGEGKLKEVNKTGSFTTGSDGGIKTADYVSSIMKRWQKFDAGREDEPPTTSAQQAGIKPTEGTRFDLSAPKPLAPRGPSPLKLQHEERINQMIRAGATREQINAERQRFNASNRGPVVEPLSGDVLGEARQGAERLANTVGPETNARLRQIEEFEKLPLSQQLGQRAYSALARGGGQLSTAARRLAGGAVKLTNPQATADIPEWRKFEDERKKQLALEAQRVRPTLGNEIAEGIVEGAPVAAAGTLLGLATGGGAIPTIATGAGLAGLTADWNDPKRAAVQTALGGVAPYVGGKVGAGIAGNVAGRLASPVAQAATRAVGEVGGGALGNMAQTGAEQLAFEGQLNPRELAKSAAIGGALSLPGALGAHPNARPEALPYPQMQRPQGDVPTSVTKLNPQMMAQAGRASNRAYRPANPNEPLDLGGPLAREAQIAEGRRLQGVANKAPDFMREVAALGTRPADDSAALSYNIRLAQLQDKYGISLKDVAAIEQQGIQPAINVQQQQGTPIQDRLAGRTSPSTAPLSPELRAERLGREYAQNARPTDVIGEAAFPDAESTNLMGQPQPVPVSEQRRQSKNANIINAKQDADSARQRAEQAIQAGDIPAAIQAYSQEADALRGMRSQIPPKRRGDRVQRAEAGTRLNEIQQAVANLRRESRRPTPKQVVQPTQPTEQSAIENAPTSEVRATGEMPKVPSREFTNRISEGEGAELPRRVGRQPEGQPIEGPSREFTNRIKSGEGNEAQQRVARQPEGVPVEVPERVAPRPKTERLPVPKASEENIASLRSRAEQLSRLAYDRRGEFPQDLRDEYSQLNSAIREYENARPVELPETETSARPVTKEFQIPSQDKTKMFTSREDARQGYFEQFDDGELVSEIARIEDELNNVSRGKVQLDRDAIDALRFDRKIAVEMQKERLRLQEQIGVDAGSRIQPRSPGIGRPRGPAVPQRVEGKGENVPATAIKSNTEVAKPDTMLPMTPAAKKQFLYHGSHEDIAELSPRAVKNIDSLGTWFTSSREAGTTYGSRVYETPEIPGNYLESPTETYEMLFGNNLPLIEKHFGKKAADTLRNTPPDNARMRELERKLEEGGGLSAGEQREVRALRAAVDIAKKALKSPAYLADWRAMMKDAGYDGVVFRDTTIDRPVTGRHTIHVIFHDKPIPLKKENAAPDTSSQTQRQGAPNQGQTVEAQPEAKPEPTTPSPRRIHEEKPIDPARQEFIRQDVQREKQQKAYESWLDDKEANQVADQIANTPLGRRLQKKIDKWDGDDPAPETYQMDKMVAEEMLKQGKSVPEDVLRFLGVEGKAKPESPARRIQHSRLGEVTEAENQKGVAKGKLRVVDSSGKESVIQNPRTRGNQSAAFVKSETEQPAKPSVSIPAAAMPELAGKNEVAVKSNPKTSTAIPDAAMPELELPKGKAKEAVKVAYPVEALSKPAAVDALPAEARPLAQRMIKRGEMATSDVPEVLRWAEAMQKASGDKAVRLPHIAEALQYRQKGEIGDTLRVFLAEADTRTGERSGMSRRAEEVLRAAGEDVKVPDFPAPPVRPTESALKGNIALKIAGTVDPKTIARSYGLPDDFYLDERRGGGEAGLYGDVVVNPKYDPEGKVIDADFAKRDALKKGIYEGRKAYYDQKVKDAAAEAVRRAAGIETPVEAPKKTRTAEAEKPAPLPGTRKYSVTTTEPGKYREVQGEPVTIPGFAKDFEFFAHQEKTNGGDYITVISEASTGFKIAQGKTREDAIKAARDILRRAGREVALKRIQEAPKVSEAPQTAEPPAPPRAKPQFVLDAEKRLADASKGKLAGSGGQQFLDTAIVTGWKVYEAGMDFGKWGKAVLKEAGQQVRPHLRNVWKQLQAEVAKAEPPAPATGKTVGEMLSSKNVHERLFAEELMSAARRGRGKITTEEKVNLVDKALEIGSPAWAKKVLSRFVEPKTAFRLVNERVRQRVDKFGKIKQFMSDEGGSAKGDLGLSDMAKYVLRGLRKTAGEGFDTGTPAQLAKAREGLGLDKQQYDDAVMELAKAGVLGLHEHDYPGSLKQDQLDALVEAKTSDKSRFMVGAALRDKFKGFLKDEGGFLADEGKFDKPLTDHVAKRLVKDLRSDPDVMRELSEPSDLKAWIGEQLSDVETEGGRSLNRFARKNLDKERFFKAVDLDGMWKLNREIDPLLTELEEGVGYVRSEDIKAEIKAKYDGFFKASKAPEGSDLASERAKVLRKSFIEDDPSILEEFQTKGELRDYLTDLLGEESNPVLQDWARQKIDEEGLFKAVQSQIKLRGRVASFLSDEGGSAKLDFGAGKLLSQLGEGGKREKQKSVPPPPKQGMGGKVLSNVGSALALPRALMASGDLSAPLRQGAILTLPPSQWGRAAKSGIRMLRSLNTKQYGKLVEELNSHPDAKVGKENGLYMSTDEKAAGSLLGREEDFISKWAGKIPIVKHSEQAYKTYLDSIRLETFKKYKKSIDGNKNLSAEERTSAYKAATDWINIASGRGSLGAGFDKAMPLLSTVFFAPRYAASRLQVLSPTTYLKNSSTPAGRAVLKQQMSDAVQFGGVITATLLLAKAAGAEVGMNPDDPDFLKIKLGNTRYDTLAGLQQFTRLFWRLSKDAANAAQGKEAARGEGALEIGSKFLRSKLAPVPSYFVDMLSRKTFTGQKFEPSRGAVERVTPLMFRDMIEAYRQEGGTGVARMTPGLFGVGVQNYDLKKDRPAARSQRRTRRAVQ